MCQFYPSCLLSHHQMCYVCFTTETPDKALSKRLEAEVTNKIGLTLREFLVVDPIPIQRCLGMYRALQKCKHSW